MSKLRTLQDLLVNQVQDLYSAESQLIEALQKMEKKASNTKLQKAFSQHREETQGHKKRLEDVCRMLNIDPKGEHCKAIEGIIKETETFMKEDAEADVMDAGLIANGQKAEHYEIATYGSVVYYAQRLGLKDAANLLNETLEEEKSADKKLNELAIERVNEEALH